MFTHIVLFKLIDRNEENAKKTGDVLMSMKGKIPFLKHIEIGVDVLHSERSYDLALYTKFDSISDMEAYKAHPVHLEVQKYIHSVRESSVSLDYND
jgi:hypothetical protein